MTWVHKPSQLHLGCAFILVEHYMGWLSATGEAGGTPQNDFCPPKIFEKTTETTAYCFEKTMVYCLLPPLNFFQAESQHGFTSSPNYIWGLPSSPPKGDWVSTVEDTHTRLCICALRKIMLIFLSAPFMGKSWGSPGKVIFL